MPVPNEHTDRLYAKAKEHGIFVQSGTMIEADPRWPGVVFNTTCLIGPGGILYKYRKVNPWIPYEVHASPHDVPGYDEPLFPVADTEIGRIGCAICYDWVFPEAPRQLAMNGAEVLVRVSAYMDPWGATEPMDWWTVVNRCRALENVAYVVAANQGAQLRRYPPYSWPGGSMVVDFDGRVLAQASPGPGERIVVAPVDVTALRHERATRRGHHMLAHLRTEAYPLYRGHVYPPAGAQRSALLRGEQRAHRRGEEDASRDSIPPAFALACALDPTASSPSPWPRPSPCRRRASPRSRPRLPARALPGAGRAGRSSRTTGRGRRAGTTAGRAPRRCASS